MSKGGARPGAGAPRKPVERQRLLGNPGHKQLPAPLTYIAPAPLAEQLAEHRDAGREESAKLLEHLLASGAAVWLGETDAAAVEVARQTWVDWTLAREEWGRSRGDKNLFNAYNELTKRLISCLSLLGLDPSGRAKLGVAEVKRQSVLDNIEARREKRRGGLRAG